MGTSTSKYKQLINEFDNFFSKVNENNFTKKDIEFELLLLKYKNDFNLKEIIKILNDYSIRNINHLDDSKLEILNNSYDKLIGNTTTIFNLNKWTNNNDIEKDDKLISLLKEKFKTNKKTYIIIKEMLDYIDKFKST